MVKDRGVYKTLHRWPGLIISFILLYYAVTGIFMNHRELFSGIDVDRNLLPEAYSYRNWNNAAVKGNLIISSDSILVFGNIGVWLTDSSFMQYSSFNMGFPGGSDNRKIFDVHRSSDGELYAASLFGLYSFNPELNAWNKFNIDEDIPRFTGIESIEDSIYAINRSHLFKGKSEGVKTTFTRYELPAPDGYSKKVTLFETMWQIHSGEIFGLPGKLFVDILGLITAFLSVTGIIYFFFPTWIKRRFGKKKSSKPIVKLNKWSLKWHNKVGAWTFVFLIILFFAGIFLRPPLLIAIAKANVSPLKYSHLDQPNPWYDKLRAILYDSERNLILLSTSDGMFYFNESDLKPKWFEHQPPISVMGINTLEPYRDGAFLIGSFSGLFLWHPSYPEVFDYARGTVYRESTSGRPIGDFKVTGTVTGFGGNKFLVDYEKGAIPLNNEIPFPEMPVNILNDSKMSLWNFSLEIHTGRIFEGLLGSFYLLLVPLIGLAGITVVISGYLLWWKKYRTKRIQITKENSIYP